MLVNLGKAVGVCDAPYSTIHGYVGPSTTFCMSTAAIVRPSALLSTELSVYSAVDVSAEFSAVQALGRLPAAGASPPNNLTHGRWWAVSAAGGTGLMHLTRATTELELICQV